MSLSPPSRTSTAPRLTRKASALQVIPPTRHTVSSVCCHQGGDCGVSRRGPADWRTASYIRLSGSWTPPPPLAPPPSFTPRNTELWHYDPPPPPAPHIPRTFHHPPPPLTNCDPHQSLCAALDWSLPHPALTVTTSSDSPDKRLFFFALHIYLHSFVLYNWFALYLPCALCHFIYLFFIFLQCPHLYICIVCMYIWFKLYLSVFERLLSVFNVNCMHQGSESITKVWEYNAISILCMYVLYMWKNWQ